MLTKSFVKDTLERSLSTAAQTAVALLSVDGLELVTFDVKYFAVTVGISFILSVLKSVAASQFGKSGDASLVK